MKAARVTTTAVVLLFLSACSSSTNGGGREPSDRQPPVAVSTGSPGSTGDPTAHVSDTDAKRAKAIVDASPLVHRATANTAYDVVEYIPGTSGTAPDLPMVSVILRLVHPVEVPAGLPCWNFPGEDDPGYGTPVALTKATHDCGAAPGTAELNVGVDMQHGTVLVVFPWTAPPTG